jgi:hypothetical protein
LVSAGEVALNHPLGHSTAADETRVDASATAPAHIFPTAAPSERAAIEIRSASFEVIAVIAVLALVFALRWASAVIIPLMVGLTVSYALNPAVDALQRFRLPRALGAALAMALVFGGANSTPFAGASVHEFDRRYQHLGCVLGAAC